LGAELPIDSWNDERVATLTRMWAEGHSATRIAAELECTRNSIIGKVTRLKLPAPVEKLPVIKDMSYARQLPEVTLQKRRERENRYARARAEKRKHCFEAKKDIRAEFIARGASPYSAAYRKHMPQLPEMSKGQLRAMLAQAAQNTAAL
jgi:hypothetical protein